MTDQGNAPPPELVAAEKVLDESFPNGWILVAKTTALELVDEQPSAIIQIQMGRVSPAELIGLAAMMMNRVLADTGQPVAIAPARLQQAPPPIPTRRVHP